MASISTLTPARGAEASTVVRAAAPGGALRAESIPADVRQRLAS